MWLVFASDMQRITGFLIFFAFIPRRNAETFDSLFVIYLEPPYCFSTTAVCIYIFSRRKLLLFSLANIYCPFDDIYSARLEIMSHGAFCLFV